MVEPVVAQYYAEHPDDRPHAVAADIDLLVTFQPDAEWSLFDHLRMTGELGAILGRAVDLVSRRAVERSHNWIRRRAILDSSRPFYDA